MILSAPVELGGRGRGGEGEGEGGRRKGEGEGGRRKGEVEGGRGRGSTSLISVKLARTSAVGNHLQLGKAINLPN